MAEPYSIVYISCLLKPVVCYGHLGCFHVMVIVNSAALNIGVHVCFQISVFAFLDIYTGVELLVDHNLLNTIVVLLIP